MVNLNRDDWFSFFNVMRLYPTAQVGAVVMGNSTKYPIDAIARLAVEFRA